jgi:predicted ribosomally synthesized peptide with SipW-like signal peptide
MDMNASKAVVFPLLLVVMLGVTGLSYAWWTETLKIDGSVATGEAKVIWNYVEGGAWARVGSPASASWAQIDDHTFSVTFSNLYPGCKINLRGYVRNMGTIPMKFDRVDITVVSDPKGVAPHIFVSPGDTYNWWDPDGNGPLPPSGPHCPVHGSYTNFPFTYLDEAINDPPGSVPGFPWTRQFPKFVLNPPTTPSDWHTAGSFGLGAGGDEDGCWNLIVDPNAPNDIEGATLTFTISFKFVQWNAP